MKWLSEPMFCACTRLETTSSPTSNTFGNWTFCEYNFLLVIYSKQKSTAMNKITRKHQNLTSASDNSIFRSSVNKAEQDLPVRQKSNAASEGWTTPPWRIRRGQSCRAEETSKTDRVSRKSATSSSETMWAKTSKAWQRRLRRCSMRTWWFVLE